MVAIRENLGSPFSLLNFQIITAFSALGMYGNGLILVSNRGKITCDSSVADVGISARFAPF